MGTVTINAISYNVYGDQTSCVNYLGGSIAYAAQSFVAANAAQQAQAMVTAARMFDRQTWQGTATGGALQWPRANVVDKFGVAVSAASIPTDIINGSYEHAAALLYDPSLQDQIDAAWNISSFNLSPASVTYFSKRPGGRFPMAVQELVGPYLARGGDPGGIQSMDTSGASATDSSSLSQFVSGRRYDQGIGGTTQSGDNDGDGDGDL